MTFIHYQFKKLLRSYSFIPPYCFFILWIVIFYFYKNQIILSSYASSSIILFVITTWLTLNIFKLESSTEKHILFIQLNSKNKFLTYKLIFALISLAPMMLFSILYPIITGRFSESLNTQTFLLSIYIHLIIVILGIIIGSIVAIQTFLSKKYSWLFLSLILVTSMIKFVLIQNYPILKYILFFIPPIGDFLNLFNQLECKNWLNKFVSLNLEFAIYIFISLFIINYIFKKSEYY
ncbi:hypothetical protein [Staphylococcus capitis]|uniref:hypothetical protein n=1 Tax=Staphylococcus capitis TaxID=29388 RepID=UPI0030176EA4